MKAEAAPAPTIPVTRIAGNGSGRNAEAESPNMAPSITIFALGKIQDIGRSNDHREAKTDEAVDASLLNQLTHMNSR
jgi:hypothetical protein